VLLVFTFEVMGNVAIGLSNRGIVGFCYWSFVGLIELKSHVDLKVDQELSSEKLLARWVVGTSTLEL
jgi:hypothetical protein